MPFHAIDAAPPCKVHLRVALAAALACMPTLAPALNLLIDTNTGKLAVCPNLTCAITANAVSFNGATITAADVSNGMRQFYVSGNFVMNEGDWLTVGNQSTLYGAMFRVSNNAVLRGTIDVSARGGGVAGGGMGGAAGLPLAPSGINTLPASGGQGGSGGAQGRTDKAEFLWIFDGHYNVNLGEDGNKGAGGANGNRGARGASGPWGGEGSPGTRGMGNQQAYVGTGGSPGMGGVHGNGGLPGLGGVGGAGGSGFGLEANWTTSTFGSLPNNGGRGDPGANGQRGSVAATVPMAVGVGERARRNGPEAPRCARTTFACLRAMAAAAQVGGAAKGGLEALAVAGAAAVGRVAQIGARAGVAPFAATTTASRAAGAATVALAAWADWVVRAVWEPRVAVAVV